MSKYIHRVVNNFMVANGGGWAKEIGLVPDGYKLDSIKPLDVYTSCIIFVNPEQELAQQLPQTLSQDKRGKNATT